MTGQPEEKQFHIQVPESVENGHYSNLAISNFSPEEFMLDFAFIQPQAGRGKLLSRIILSPGNAKRLAQLLHLNVLEYEKKFGTIANSTLENQDGIKLSFN